MTRLLRPGDIIDAVTWFCGASPCHWVEGERTGTAQRAARALAFTVMHNHLGLSYVQVGRTCGLSEALVRYYVHKKAPDEIHVSAVLNHARYLVNLEQLALDDQIKALALTEEMTRG